MTDKVQKIREEIARLKEETSIGLSEHENGVEQGRMEIINALSLFIDSLQEEPVSEDLEEAADKYSQSIHSDYFNDMFDSHNIYDAVIYGAKWGKHQAEVETQAQSMALAHGCPKESITEDLENAAFDYAEDCKYDGVEKLLCVEHFKAGAKWQKGKDEYITDDLGEYISELSKQFPEVSFAKLSRIAVRVAKWKERQFEKNRLKHCNSITNEQAELEQGFIDQHLDKYRRMPTFLDAIEYGMTLQKEQMMKDAVESKVTITSKGILLEDLRIEDFDYEDKVKLMVIKEE